MTDDLPNVPREFHSAYSEAPFTECIDCGCRLNDSEEPYVIVKSFVGAEAVFEMAICTTCARKMREQYSQQTKQNLEAYLNQHLEFDRQFLMPSEEEDNLDLAGLISKRISSCAICTKPQSDCHRFEIVGQFLPEKLLRHFPEELRHATTAMAMMMCDDCNSKMSELISQQTRDSWNRFVEDHFDGPPGIELDSPSMQPILL